VSTGDFKILPAQTSVDYSNNEITSIDITRNFSKILNVIHLNDNPITCDCELQNFLTATKQNENFKVKSLRCYKPESLRGKLVDELEMVDLSCPTNFCPEKCTCDLSEDKTFLINCTNVGLEEFPFFPTGSFDDNLKIELHISRNRISNFPHNWENLKNIEKIFASDNQIKEINVENLPKSLKVLELGQNLLERLEGSIDKLMDFDRLTLGGNPWKCDCDNLQLFNLIKKNSKLFGDLEAITCADRNITLISLQPEEICQSKKIFYILGGCGLALAGILMGIYVYLEVSKEDPPLISEKPAFFLGSTNLRIVLVAKDVR
jgi:Leucine-rich repeat (LRR) protein